MQTSANPAVTSCRQIPLRRCFQHVIVFRDIFQMSGHFYHLLLLLFPVVHLMHVYLPFEFIYHHKSSLSDSHWCHWMKRPVESWRANSEIMVFCICSVYSHFGRFCEGSSMVCCKKSSVFGRFSIWNGLYCLLKRTQGALYCKVESLQ